MYRLTVVLFIGLAGCQQPLSAPLQESGKETFTQQEASPDFRAAGATALLNRPTAF